MICKTCGKEFHNSEFLNCDECRSNTAVRVHISREYKRSERAEEIYPGEAAFLRKKIHTFCAWRQEPCYTCPFCGKSICVNINASVRNLRTAEAEIEKILAEKGLTIYEIGQPSRLETKTVSKIDRGYDRLIQAVVGQAIRDYINAYNAIHGHGDDCLWELVNYIAPRKFNLMSEGEKTKALEAVMEEVEDFFTSKYFEKLTGYDGQTILDGLKENMKGDKIECPDWSVLHFM